MVEVKLLRESLYKKQYREEADEGHWPQSESKKKNSILFVFLFFFCFVLK